MSTPTHLTAQATSQHMVELRALQDLDLSKRWCIAWYQLDMTPRPVTHIEPGRVSVRALQEPGAGQQLWPPIRAPRKRKPAQTKVAAGVEVSEC